MVTSAKDLKIVDEPQSRANSYAFIKQNIQFIEIESKFKTPDADPGRLANHSVSLLRKAPKSGASSTYSTHNYFKIKSLIGIKPDCQKRLNRINVLSSELMRLLDRHSPKLRLWTDGKTDFPLSKSVPEPNEFFMYFKENIYSKVKYTPPKNDQSANFEYIAPDFFEGMGRSFFGKYIYLDNDFHMGNAFLDKDKYFCAIDNDWTFIPVTFVMHNDLKYDNGYDFVPRKYNIQISVGDYDGLPIFQDYIAGNWPWDSDPLVKNYFEKLAKDPLFINEKHFTAIKFLITPQFQKYLVEYHINDNNDKKELLTLLEKRVANLANILPRSQSFMAYIRKYRLALIQAILFELNDFFMENRHYLPARDKPHESKQQWHDRIYPKLEKLINPVIQNYSCLLAQIGEAPLTELEKSNLERFSLNIYTGNAGALNSVKSFYVEQKMKNFAELVEQMLRENIPNQSLDSSPMKTVAK